LRKRKKEEVCGGGIINNSLHMEKKHEEVET
jgi:hypothetical protein